MENAIQQTVNYLSQTFFPIELAESRSTLIAEDIYKVCKVNV